MKKNTFMTGALALALGLTAVTPAFAAEDKAVEKANEGGYNVSTSSDTDATADDFFKDGELKEGVAKDGETLVEENLPHEPNSEDTTITDVGGREEHKKAKDSERDLKWSKDLEVKEGETPKEGEEWVDDEYVDSNKDPLTPEEAFEKEGQEQGGKEVKPETGSREVSKTSGNVEAGRNAKTGVAGIATIGGVLAAAATAYATGKRD